MRGDIWGSFLRRFLCKSPSLRSLGKAEAGTRISFSSGVSRGCPDIDEPVTAVFMELGKHAHINLLWFPTDENQPWFMPVGWNLALIVH